MGAFERASGEDKRAAVGLIPPEATLAQPAAAKRHRCVAGQRVGAEARGRRREGLTGGARGAERG
jgi:hypothetical protein